MRAGPDFWTVFPQNLAILLGIKVGGINIFRPSQSLSQSYLAHILMKVLCA